MPWNVAPDALPGSVTVHVFRTAGLTTVVHNVTRLFLHTFQGQWIMRLCEILVVLRNESTHTNLLNTPTHIHGSL